MKLSLTEKLLFFELKNDNLYSKLMADNLAII